MYYGNVTFLLCMPRSRSAWLCEFLRPVAHTLHDPLKTCANIDELGDRIDSLLRTDPMHPIFVGDTAAPFFYDQIIERFPCARYLFVLRSFEDTAQSLHLLGLPDHGLHAARKLLMDALDVIVRDTCYQKFVGFDAINDELLNIWRFVGGLIELPEDYRQRAIATNIQIPFTVQNRNTDIGKVTKLFQTRSAFP
jgi:hypothetical protein